MQAETLHETEACQIWQHGDPVRHFLDIAPGDDKVLQSLQAAYCVRYARQRYTIVAENQSLELHQFADVFCKLVQAFLPTDNCIRLHLFRVRVRIYGVIASRPSCSPTR